MAAFGTIKYGDYTFGDLSKCQVQTVAIYDDAKRTVVQIMHRFTVSSVIVAEGPDVDANDAYQRVKEQLQEEGQRFEISGKGFGDDLVVNDIGGGLKDIAFGPQPKMLSWDPVGHTNAVEFEWEISLTLPPECSSLNFVGIMAYNYGINWTINEGGFTTRTITGYLEIAMTGLNFTIVATADTFLDQIKITKIDNFHRVQSRDLSLDKKRLNFVVTDTEIESGNDWPADVTNITGTHQVRTKAAYRAKSTNILSVRVTLQATAQRTRAWEIFRSIVDVRTTAAKAGNTTVMLKDLELIEDLFGYTMDFTLTYDVIRDDILNLGLFETLGFDFSTWAASMVNITDDRGLGGMSHQIGDDKITNLCSNTTPTISSGYTFPTKSNGTLTVLTNTVPDAQKSYILWDARLIEDTDYGKAYAVELGSVTSLKNAFNTSDTNATLAAINGLDVLEDTIAEAGPAMYWRWVGKAQRLSFPIPAPDLSSVGGVTLEKVLNNKLTQRNLGNYFGQDLFQTEWDFLYRVVVRPGSVKTLDFSIDPNNPVSP